MKIKKKGKVYPSPSSSSSSSSFAAGTQCPSDGDFLAVLKLLPAAILALASVLSLEDREVLAYMVTRSMKPTNPSPITHKRKPPQKKFSPNNNTHKPPVFDCDCFDCYTSYWFRWDSSPNRELIHQAIEAFEDHLAHGEQSKKVNGRGKRREKPVNRRVPEKPSDASETPVVPPETEESSFFSLTSQGNDAVSVSSTDKADGVLEDKAYEVVVEKVREEKDEVAESVVGRTVVAASNDNHHKGLARKVLPDVLGLFNSRLWSLWSPNV
ncbi:uncharacterized protein LOC133864297 [Alnus glutinosa]|uniref:uncharacterized protein LOC133864297 n=1 Tax=Alnus glutinosa TaxID=3517 RepID=UPI002D793062|nr:uncharacterized protein LOC133864297 [Alnus glutinosa]